MANGPVSLSEEQRKRLLKERQGRQKNIKGGTGKDEEPNDWVKDLGGILKKSGSGVAKAADAVTDVLIDKDSWKNTAQAIADGPGGKKLNASDVGNNLLDLTMLVPGAGAAGLAARVGGRGLARFAAKEGTRVAERELSPLAAKAAARKAGGRRIAGAAEGTAAEGAESATRAGGRHVATSRKASLSDRLGTKTERAGEDLVHWGETGGKRLGRSQSKKMLALTGGATVGANLATRAYDEAGGDEKPKGTTGDPGLKLVGPNDGGTPSYMIGNMLYPVETGSDGGIQIPNSTARALADYLNKGGSPDGAQVVYLGH